MRALVLLLALANLGWFALAQGWLLPYAGLAMPQQREPHRLATQVNVDSVRVLSAAEAACAASTAAGEACAPAR